MKRLKKFEEAVLAAHIAGSWCKASEDICRKGLRPAPLSTLLARPYYLSECMEEIASFSTLTLTKAAAERIKIAAVETAKDSLRRGGYPRTLAYFSTKPEPAQQ